MKIIIEPTNNGAIVTWGKEKVVYQFGSSEHLDDAIEMFYEIALIIGLNCSRYAKERILFRVEHGDKYLCNDRECSICKEDK